ncbi:MAG: bifunctional 4-hydroxy-2-oxoglutarate aldolase/2-dehydro-3-deoxy-phosphogluconate aldolase, partial [bacterium]
EDLGVFPIIVIDRVADVVPLGEALMRAGLPCAEVTFRTEAAAKAISTLSKEFPEMLLGAGTVLKLEQADAAIDAGATFMVTPGFNHQVVDHCIEKGIDIYPGVCTPTEMDTAVNKGLTVLKFFPAEAMGGLSFLKAVSAPLSMVRFIPTGGVNLQNFPDYLAFNKTLACAGTWIVKKTWLAEGRFDLIEQEAASAVAVVKKVRGETTNG